MRVIESFVASKSPDAGACEDFIAATRDFVAVIDGATDKTGREYLGMTGGRFASRLIASELNNLPRGVEPREAVHRLSEALKARVPHQYPDPPSASLAMYSDARREVWTVGDVSFTAVGPGEELRPPASKPLDRVAAGVRSALLTALLNEGSTEADIREFDPGREAILPLLTRQHALRNTPGQWGYGAIDGTAVPEEFLLVHPIDSRVSEIVIYSDGYPNAYPSLGEAESALAALLAADPLCINELMSTKGWAKNNVSFDDRAYVRFSL